MSPSGYWHGSLMHAQAYLACAQAVLRNAHPRLRLKQQLIRSKDGNGNSHVDIPMWKVLLQNYLPLNADKKPTAMPILNPSLNNQPTYPSSLKRSWTLSKSKLDFVYLLCFFYRTWWHCFEISELLYKSGSKKLRILCYLLYQASSISILEPRSEWLI